MGKISFTIDSAADLTTVVVKGTLICQEVKDTISQYALEEHTGKVLWNCQEADASKITIDELQSIHEHSRILFANRPDRKIAVVVKRQLGFGLSRMSGIYREITIPQSNYATYYSIDEALEWLAQGKATNNAN